MRHEKTNSLAGLLVFGLFALALLLVLLTGAKVYRRTVADTEAASDARTKVQYLSTRVRQGQSVAVEDFYDCPALTIREEKAGECYVTRIYIRDGWLRELTAPEGAALTPPDGEKVLPAQELSFSEEEKLLIITIDGEILYLSR